MSETQQPIESHPHLATYPDAIQDINVAHETANQVNELENKRAGLIGGLAILGDIHANSFDTHLPREDRWYTTPNRLVTLRQRNEKSETPEDEKAIKARNIEGAQLINSLDPIKTESLMDEDPEIFGRLAKVAVDEKEKVDAQLEAKYAREPERQRRQAQVDAALADMNR